MLNRLVLVSAIVACYATTVPGQSWSVVSPNGQVQMTVKLDGAGEKHLQYTVEQGPANHRETILQASPLGLQLKSQDFTALVFDSATPERTLEESYTLVHGKRRDCRNRARELSLTFHSTAGVPLVLDLRAYDNGVAFRYRLPSGLEGPQIVQTELTGFALPSGAKIWCAPSDKPSTYSPAYETHYESDMAVGTPSPLGMGWSFPMLFRTADSQHWALITEAGVDEHYCGSRLSNDASTGSYTITFPNPADGNGQGSIHPTSVLPWQMPWRVVVVGSSLATIVESTLVTDVCPPQHFEDTSWIRPGRVAWSWWSDNPSPKDAEKQKKFVDLAAEMGWEYVLVDANWTIMDKGNIHDVLRYAKQKGVGVLLWYNSGGPHNVVTEKPRDCFTYAPVRKFELSLLRDWGVKGAKIDFFQSDKQDVISLYQGILHDAAEQRIMVNFHGCTLPRGWERTYPNLMSMEAVRGEECYIFDANYPERAPVQNTILPFTRNAVGPMDYTPVGLSNNRYPHRTTTAHELALTVLFETGWLHFADKPESYLNLPPVPKQFLKDVPVAWDETRFVDGYPGEFAILARRKENTWYIGGVNGTDRPRNAQAVKPAAWLGEGRWKATLITDASQPGELKSKQIEFDAAQGFQVDLHSRGGFIAIVQKL